MQLTQHTDFSLRVLLYLAAYPGERISTQQISAAYGISHNHLIKVVNRLGHLGYIHVWRGRGGGIELARPAADIVVGDVVRQTESNFNVVECFNPDGKCPIKPVCGLIPVLDEALNSFFDVLDNYTIADALGDRERYLPILQHGAKD